MLCTDKHQQLQDSLVLHTNNFTLRRHWSMIRFHSIGESQKFQITSTTTTLPPSLHFCHPFFRANKRKTKQKRIYDCVLCLLRQLIVLWPNYKSLLIDACVILFWRKNRMDFSFCDAWISFHGSINWWLCVFFFRRTCVLRLGLAIFMFVLGTFWPSDGIFAILSNI